MTMDNFNFYLPLISIKYRLAKIIVIDIACNNSSRRYIIVAIVNLNGAL